MYMIEVLSTKVICCFLKVFALQINVKIVKNYYLCSCFDPPYKVNCYGNGDESAT